MPALHLSEVALLRLSCGSCIFLIQIRIVQNNFGCQMSNYEVIFDISDEFQIPKNFKRKKYTGLRQVKICDGKRTQLQSTWEILSDYEQASIDFETDLKLCNPSEKYLTKNIEKTEGILGRLYQWISNGKTLVNGITYKTILFDTIASIHIKFSRKVFCGY